MSNAVFPTLPGLTFSVSRAPEFATLIQKSVAGREVRAALQAYPIYNYTLKYEFLRAAATWLEFQNLFGFYLLRQGAFDSFLLDDPDDNVVTAQSIGTGDGANKNFQLARTIGGFTEPVYDVHGAPVIKVAGITKTVVTDYTISATGLVAFVAAPAAAAAVTADFSYYWRVRFADDKLSFAKFMSQLWEAQTVGLRGVKL